MPIITNVLILELGWIEEASKAAGEFGFARRICFMKGSGRTHLQNLFIENLGLTTSKICSEKNPTFEVNVWMVK